MSEQFRERFPPVIFGLCRWNHKFVKGLPGNNRAKPARRTRRRSLDELVNIALIAYDHYVHPFTSRPRTQEELIGVLEDLRQSRMPKITNALRLPLAWTGGKLNPST